MEEPTKGAIACTAGNRPAVTSKEGVPKRECLTTDAVGLRFGPSEHRTQSTRTSALWGAAAPGQKEKCGASGDKEPKEPTALHIGDGGNAPVSSTAQIIVIH